MSTQILDASVQIFMIIERVVVEVYSRKRISLRGLVRRRLMDITSALDKDEKGKAKGVTKEGDSKEDQFKEKAKNQILEDKEEQ